MRSIKLELYMPNFENLHASIVLALLLQIAALQLLSFVADKGIVPLLAVLIGAVLTLVNLLLNIYLFSFIILVVVSWIAPQSHSPVLDLLRNLTEPVLRPIRNVLPPMGGFDFSVMAAILLIYILKILEARSESKKKK